MGGGRSVNDHHSVGIVNGRPLVEDSADKTENCGICRDPKREREHSDDSKTWIFPQHARAEAQVLPENVQQRQSAAFAVILFGLFHAAKFHDAPPAGLVPETSQRAVVFDVQLEMALHLGREVLLAPLLAEHFA